MRKRSAVWSALSIAALVAIGLRATASVTQVDGNIVPDRTTETNIFTFLKNHGEEPNAVRTAGGGSGSSATSTTFTFNPATDIDPVADASESPQVFTPDTSKAVVFEDIGEGAGFENSFGWYNVGDDVQTAAGRIKNLHVVLGCGVPMAAKTVPFNPADNTQHYGDPAFYVQNAEETAPGNGPGLASVDFASEGSAGRYKGGFISFYLITPEGSQGQGSAEKDNCGDFTINSNNHSKLGKVYFTQKDLNNDGDFVHYLTYTSKAKANTFVFGFEDLFRGGDNDFEDMLIRVNGITPPCVPTTEICDGLDNDCDGNIDESTGSATLPGVGDTCQCDSSSDCDNGPKLGVCANGNTICKAGKLTCHTDVTPKPELCDLKDNDCNGFVDDNPTDSTINQACDGPDGDSCPEGQIKCLNGQLACNDNTGTTVEICNKIDDDCDGKVDEGNPGGGGACGTNVGACKQGVLTCNPSTGNLDCVGQKTGTVEICNGIDDDCDGIIDENPTDVGSACGGGSGECRPGQIICVGGAPQCAGATGPTTETCNGKDDDCDGKIDENPVDVGQACGVSTGACEPGKFVCDPTTHKPVCQGGTGPGSEICNNIDDDCDGTVDEDIPGVGSACNAGGSGACATGVDRCINGVEQCVGGSSGGTETCNNIDDDCDGKIDEGVLCEGGICDHGVCAAPCVDSEFPCPNGKICVAMYCVDDPCAGKNCPADGSGNAQSCQGSDGHCAAVCDTVQCSDPFVCRGRDGQCVPDTCDYLPKCAANELCINSACTSDPCAGVSCTGNTFCRAGACVASCDGVQCDDGQECRDGACAATGCAFNCPTGKVCDPTSGTCTKDLCTDVVCPNPNQACDPLTGDCAADPCIGIVCPNMEVCTRQGTVAQCGLGAHGQLITAAGGGGCDASGGDVGGFAAVGLVLGALLLRRRRALLVPAIAALSLAASGCKLNNYCIDCETDDGGIHNPGDGGSDGSGSGGSGGSNGCDPNNVRQETCNHADDDCDGVIDNGFDLTKDPHNCGACGVECNKPGAQTACQNSQCVITGCFPGFNDVNHDIGDYATSNGCEYVCFKSNNGVEACDGLDNDCNGGSDDGIDTSSDPKNCGQCGRVCDFFQATGHCTTGNCEFNPATDCAPGFFDIDHLQADGCEYACAPTNNGVEKCDLIDNNCDGVVDDGFNLDTDAANCGRCGNACSFPHASASCSGGGCLFNPATDCAPGFVDINGKQIDGCEYQCTKTNGGVEICDGKDNDCDGVADDNLTDVGGACASTSPPKGICTATGTQTCANGRLVCSNAPEATVETCDNKDDDCDGKTDENIVQSCYSGSASTNGVGQCHGGTQTCGSGTFPTACSGEVLPGTEVCNGKDDDCNGVIDNGPNGGPITQPCYSGPANTNGVGTCVGSTKTCANGTFPTTCPGEVVPTTDVCGDNLDTDCDGKNDAAEGCIVTDGEIRLDGKDGNGSGSGSGGLGTDPGVQHSHDVQIAVGGVPLGKNVYVVWSDLVGVCHAPCSPDSNGATRVFLRTSSDGGKTFGTIVDVTAAVGNRSVEPAIAVAPGADATKPDTVVIAYQNVNNGLRDIFVQMSADSGVTFTAPVGLHAGGDSFHQAVALRGSTAVVTWEQLDTSTLNRDVQSRTSTDAGKTFKPTMTLNTSASGTSTRFAGRPQVGITDTGGVVWAWREQRSGATRDIFATSTTVATTAPVAANEKRIDGDAAAPNDNRDSDFPVLIVVDKAAYLVWQDTSTLANGGSDVIFSRSTDGGLNWSTEKIIDDPLAEVSSSFTPTMSVVGNTLDDATDDVVAIAWEDRRQGTEVFASVSKNGGTTFSSALRASNENSGPVAGQVSLPSIAAMNGGNTLVVSWQNDQTEQLGSPPKAKQTSHIFSSSSIDEGVSWTVTHEILDDGTKAVLPHVIATSVSAKAAAFTVWTDFRTNGINGDIYGALSH